MEGIQVVIFLLIFPFQMSLFCRIPIDRSTHARPHNLFNFLIWRREKNTFEKNAHFYFNVSRSNSNSSYAIKVLGSKRTSIVGNKKIKGAVITIEKVLENSKAFQAFMEHLMKEFSSENLLVCA